LFVDFSKSWKIKIIADNHHPAPAGRQHNRKTKTFAIQPQRGGSIIEKPRPLQFSPSGAAYYYDVAPTELNKLANQRFYYDCAPPELIVILENPIDEFVLSTFQNRGK
jgi:hypothetical protein